MTRAADLVVTAVTRSTRISPGETERDRAKVQRMGATDEPTASHVHVSARAVAVLVRALAAQGLPVDAFLASAELEPTAMADPDARVPYEKVLRVWVAALGESRDEYLGLHTAARVRIEDYELLGYLMRTCPTLGEVLAGFSRYQWLLADAIEIAVDFEGPCVRVRYAVPFGYQLPRPVAEYVIGVVVVLLRQALREEFAPREVCFAHPAPPDLTPYEQLFQCPVRFGADGASVLLDLDLARTLATADSDLHRTLRRHADLLIERAAGDTLVARVSRLVEEKLLRASIDGFLGHDLMDPDEVARALAVSPRTLRRQLGEHGTSLKSIADSLRRELALHYLASSTLSVGEIAFLTGFSEPSAFHRAFKRWTDQTPAAFRSVGRG